ncbi:hypothetical protein GOP47_0012818 [Adiantum capillus-veneris]|uniref:Uncharacterized protein n=1 Tax=Adiantum capillus-veneris TaxID=13818 RepID=A0A9D4ZG22_ADICA|nr:hypothetical protein GOP47_0012818 [Adiantum capillus-veneris]
MAAGQPSVNFKEGVNFMGESSKDHERPPAILLYAYKNGQDSRILKDSMNHSCVQIGDNPVELQYRVLDTYDGKGGYMDEQGAYYMIVKSPNVADKWEQNASKTKVDDEGSRRNRL